MAGATQHPTKGTPTSATVQLDKCAVQLQQRSSTDGSGASAGPTSMDWATGKSASTSECGQGRRPAPGQSPTGRLLQLWTKWPLRTQLPAETSVHRHLRRTK